MFLGGASSAVEFYNMHVGVVNWRLGGQQSVPSAATSTTMTSTMMCVYIVIGPQLPQPTDFCVRDNMALISRWKHVVVGQCRNICPRPYLTLT